MAKLWEALMLPSRKCTGGVWYISVFGARVCGLHVPMLSVRM